MKTFLFATAFLVSASVKAAVPDWCPNYNSYGETSTVVFGGAGCTNLQITLEGMCTQTVVNAFGSDACEFSSTAGQPCCVTIDPSSTPPHAVVNTNSGCINPCIETPAPTPMPTPSPVMGPTTPTIPTSGGGMPTPTGFTPLTLPPLPPVGFRSCSSLGINSFTTCDNQCVSLGLGSGTDYESTTETIDGKTVTGTSCTCEGTLVCIGVTSGGGRASAYMSLFLGLTAGVVGFFVV